MLRLIGSIIGALLDHCHGQCPPSYPLRLAGEGRKGEAYGLDRWRWQIFKCDPRCVTFVAQLLLAPKRRMPRASLCDYRRGGTPIGLSTVNPVIGSVNALRCR